jgi:DNA (cytosine-5)-methyltransferase 1
MGLADDYRLPPRATAAFQVIGDGVATPVVRFLAEQLIEPLCADAPAMAAAE